MHEFSILLRRAHDVDGQWIAHCLNWDLVSQGSSPSDAERMINEAILIAIEEDQEAGRLDPADRPPAPEEFWEIFARIQQVGTRIAAADIDTLADRTDVAIAATLYLKTREVKVPRLPPPFMIAQFQDANCGAN